MFCTKKYICKGICVSGFTINRLWIEFGDRFIFAFFKNASLFMLPHENEAGRKAQLSAATS